ncbi:MAG: hypothetical protein ACK6BG_12600 [Cyanobacteriota bacterium]
MDSSPDSSPGPRPTAPRPRRSTHGPRAWSLLMATALAWGLPGASEPKRYDPDKDTCQTEVIRRAYHANLLPWQDQPDAVVQRLRQLQAAMTRDTLRECQGRGLMSPAEAASLEAELGLGASSGAAPPAQSPSRP